MQYTVFRVFAACLLFTGGLPLRAADAPLCRALEEIVPQAPTFARQPKGLELLVNADKASLDDQDTAIFHGGASIQYNDLILQANTLIYRRDTGEIEARDGVTLWDKDLVIQSDYLQVLPDEQIGGTGTAEYWMPSRRGRGQAEKILKHSDTEIELFGTTYTTCDPGKEAWLLQMRRTVLDFETDTGTSYGSLLRIAGIPVFYLPYIEYPISDKPKSGFLVPSIANSSKRGFEFTIPYYWRLAPNYDLTVAPHFMSKRGVALNSEFRYLLPRHSGEAYLEYLPDDRERGNSRYFFDLKQRARITPKLTTRLTFSQVSDVEYFKDFGDGLDAAAGNSYLTRQASASYRLFPSYTLGVLANDYQMLLPTVRMTPYRTVPGITLTPSVRERNRRLNTFVKAEWKRFERETPGTSPVPEAMRLDVVPWLSYPLRFSAGFIEPKLVLRYTAYNNEYSAASRRTDTTLTRFTPTFSTDMGVFFERETESWLQTLEPRVFYQYTPYHDQDSLPVLDTSAYDLSWAQLFRTERYSGPDRVSDEHSVALALSTRWLERSSGIERLRMGIGQIFYLEERRVGLPHQVLSSDSSALIAEIAAQATKALSASYTVQWDDGEIPYHVARVRYHRSPQHLLNLSYRQRDDRLSMEQTDLSWRWPLNRRWSTLGRWNYSIEHSTDLESLLGFEYNSCCWAVRLVGRRYLEDLKDKEYATSIHLQIQLKGLAGLGKSDMLAERIPGFIEDLD
jgi:LPS-assembly protein